MPAEINDADKAGSAKWPAPFEEKLHAGNSCGQELQGKGQRREQFK
jgi:hypothetical protein